MAVRYRNGNMWSPSGETEGGWKRQGAAMESDERGGQARTDDEKSENG